MPLKEAHLTQADKSEKLAEELLNQGVYTDWGITCLFYSALHYVEAALALRHINSEDHGDRTRNIGHYLRYVNTDYAVLRNLSEDVRYDLLPVGQDEIEQARQNFKAIREGIRKRERL